MTLQSIGQKQMYVCGQSGLAIPWGEASQKQAHHAFTKASSSYHGLPLPNVTTMSVMY